MALTLASAVIHYLSAPGGVCVRARAGPAEGGLHAAHKAVSRIGGSPS